ncbi:MAG: glycosyltransferase family 39 protein [Bacteroidetes bacterium]|nr:glycosyltransferase family 39 protein [Bacteroidota bacterium]
MKHLIYRSQTGLLLFFIILVGAVLRFWHFQDIPFTFDELSAMSRTQFDSFHDLIRIGVVERDSHPAGIQLFLYYWSILFGESEMVIKLPFLLAGIASVYLVYRIGIIWFGKTSGILSAAYVSSLQLFVMYSQIARPYISGLFFTLCAVLFWSKYFFRSPEIKYIAGFVIFSALAAYNHYFSLLFIAVLGISGLFLINRKNWLAYILAGVAILMLYIPHLSIIFAQAEKGTIGGWLGAPGPYFLMEFAFWLFHHSYFAIAVFVLIIVVGFTMNKSTRKLDLLRKKRWLLLIWLLPAPIFGYIYSFTKEPILQYSLLIFTAPYLFLLMLSFVGEWKVKSLGFAIMLILSVNILTLIFSQDYYRNFYRQPFNQMIKNAMALEADNEGEVFIINDYIPYYTEYYLRKYDQELSFYTTRNKEVRIADFKRMLSKIEQNVVITSGLDDKYFQVILEQFPYWEGFETGFTYEQYVFSRKDLDGNSVPGRTSISEASFNRIEDTLWQYNQEDIIIDTSSGSYQYLMTPEVLYGPKMEIPLADLMGDIYRIIDVELEIVSIDSILNAVIVGEIKKGEEMVHWQGTDFSAYGLETGKPQKVFLTMDIQKAMSDKNEINNQIARFYIWNRDKQQFIIKSINIFLRPGNPGRYRL